MRWCGRRGTYGYRFLRRNDELEERGVVALVRFLHLGCRIDRNSVIAGADTGDFYDGGSANGETLDGHTGKAVGIYNERSGLGIAVVANDHPEGNRSGFRLIGTYPADRTPSEFILHVIGH